MKRSVFMVLATLAVLFCGAPQKASADCGKCRIIALACNADFCEAVMGCVSSSFGQVGFSECEVDLLTGTCSTGAQCLWALTEPPVEKDGHETQS